MKKIFVAMLGCAWVAAGAGFTLEQVLSAPFPSDMVAAPGGQKVAWLLNERGARNVWMAAAPDWKGVRVTSYTKDDGQDIGELHWTPDAKSVYYTRGGDLEFPGRPDPNPSVNPEGVEQAVWMVAQGAAPRKIADGYAPALASKGGRMALIHSGQIWIAGPGDKTAPLYHARAGVTSNEPVWSPDGEKLAFVSDRGNHSFIAVYDFGGNTLSYLDPSVDRDRNPVWSPDGKQVAFLRVAAGSEAGWSIRVATVSDGIGRQIWGSEKGAGNAFHLVVAESQLFWAAGDRIVFPWEKDGWTHLYAVPVEGGSAAQLNKGNFEVENVSMSEDRREMLLSSNEGDIDRRHIWRVPVTGGAAKAVTSGTDLEWMPVAVSGGVAFLHSGPKQPARAAIETGGSVKDLAPDSIPADFPVNALVIPQQVIYNATDGMAIHGQLFLPADLKPGEKRKALVFIHGGSRRQMLLGWHYMDYYNNAYGMNQYLANQGYIVLAINYRSGIGYGLAFREPANYGARGASEFNDVEGAGLYLKNRPDVDAAHVGLWGGSYGGYLTAMGLARASNLFAAGVDFHGVHDWTVRNAANANAAAASGDPAVEAARQEALRVAFASSPMASVSGWKSPVLLIHGDDDRNVNFSETVTLVGALRKQGVYFEQLILPDEIHGFLRHASWLRAYHATADFFARKM